MTFFGPLTARTRGAMAGLDRDAFALVPHPLWITMLPPPSTVVGSAKSSSPSWLSYTTWPVSVTQIFIRILSSPPPPGSCPSLAFSRNEGPAPPLTVPPPLNFPFGPPHRSQSYEELWKFRSPA